MANPTDTHLKFAKRILRYIRGLTKFSITYCFGDIDDKPGDVNSQNNVDFKAYSDSDWAGDNDKRRSTSGYVITAGGGPISWRSGLQSIVALSSCEAEYIALGECVKEILWLQQLLADLNYRGTDARPFQVYEDNRAAIDLAKNPGFHKRTKHIDVRYHFVQDHLTEGDIVISYLDTNNMVADGLTKSLGTVKHKRFLEMLNMTDTSAN